MRPVRGICSKSIENGPLCGANPHSWIQINLDKKHLMCVFAEVPAGVRLETDSVVVVG